MRGTMKLGGIAAGIAFAATIAGCGASADVTRQQLMDVVERDSVVFNAPPLPGPVVERLASSSVVVLGETHHLREHWELVADLVRQLHPFGVRQLLVEGPHMADWLFDDYATGGTFEPDFVLPEFWLRKFQPIREFNDALPVADRVHLRAIDLNQESYGGAAAFRDLLRLFATHLPTAGPIEPFLVASYADPAAQLAAISDLELALADGRDELVASWGSALYERAVEMVEVEKVSVEYRAMEDGSDASFTREEVIKQLAEARIDESEGRSLVNVGGHHAQKAPLMGPDQEWLGDYLAHRSPACAGSVSSVVFAAARTELELGASGTPWNILESSSPENELHRIMAETAPGMDVFLWLDDPIFAEHRIAMNSEDTIYTTPFSEQFDAVLQYGVAHRMPSS